MGFDNMANIENTYKTTSQINNGVYVVKDGDSQWGGVLNHNFEILSQLNKRAKLIITYGDHTALTVLMFWLNFHGSQYRRYLIPAVY